MDLRMFHQFLPRGEGCSTGFALVLSYCCHAILSPPRSLASQLVEIGYPACPEPLEVHLAVLIDLLAIMKNDPVYGA